ncbi:MAG: aminoacetone oxidase family FAD-binding enzyme [Lachnospiraceae bacterium]|nr:aminoacetone oxidase family FAD-binding enzyme [Lachnospiraceae bacterium]
MSDTLIREYHRSREVHDKIIIGGGAAGLMAAYSACKISTDGGFVPDVLLLEGKEIVGKKLAATGNGKCNFTNMYQDICCYRSDNSAKAYRIINNFDNQKTISLFRNLGIISTERKGYCYPIGEQARTFRDVLKERVISLGTVIYTEKYVIGIDKSDSVFSVTCSDLSVYYSKKLIICVGGSAAPVFGTDGNMFGLLEKMGFKIIKPKPALCGLRTDCKYLKILEGVRLKCECSLYSSKRGNIIYKEQGEIIFSKNGISGIPILNLSRFAINELDDGNKCGVLLDFFPDMNLRKLKDYLTSTVISCGDGAVGVVLSALVNDKLLKTLFRELSIDYDTSSKVYDVRTIRNELGRLSEMLKSFNVNIIGDTGFENAQTTQGGVILKEIDENNMESYKYPGLYFAGEVLDVDGMCGGYNLQWAWTTGYIAGRN